MIPTPSLSHLKKSDYEKVYEPAEDTFVFLDALELDKDRLTAQETRPRVVCEIGPGSGCVSAFLASILGDQQALYISTDINSHATEATKRTGAENKATLEPVLASLLSPLLTSMQGTVTPVDAHQTPTQRSTPGKLDIILFNPPYVPTTAEEEEQAQRDAEIAGSWAGGNTGTKLLEVLIEDIDGLGRGAGIETVLSPGGSFYFVAIKQNDPHALVERLKKRGLDAEITFSRRAGREHLFVVRATRPLQVRDTSQCI